MTRAFTLIELLVVVTIIVILLAMLTPALDKAIYQAELAVCGSRLKGITNAATLYAEDHSRFYPTRDPMYAWDSIIIRHPNKSPAYPTYDAKGGWPGGFDLRPLYTPYMTLNQFLDPLCGQGLSLAPEDNKSQSGVTGTRGDVFIYASYHINTGWRPNETAVGVDTRALRKLGDKWTVSERLDLTTPVDRQFSVIASDVENTARGGGYVQSSHPDMTYGSLNLYQFQAKDAAPDVYAPVEGGGFVLTWGVWQGGVPSNIRREKSDYNYAYTDGSVRRYNAVKYDDDRMAKSIVTSWDEYARIQRYWQLPESGD